MRLQVTLTVSESKRLIAKGMASHPLVKNALASGRIFLKGGTTVSAVCEELVGIPLRISGRIVPRGTKTSQKSLVGFHCAVIEGGELINAEEELDKVITSLRRDDIGIIGANALDVHGNAALMYGAPLGGGPGRIISALMAEIQNVFVVVGLEKLVPGSIIEIVSKAGRKNVDVSMGMAVGLTPLMGIVVNERDAIHLLGAVNCTVIAMGGIMGAEGATTMIIDGKKEEVEKVHRTIMSVKGASVSGLEESLEECIAPNEKCKVHRACFYKREKQT